MQMSNDKKIIAAITVLLILDFVILVARVLSRRIKKLRLDWNDWLVLVALVR